MLQACLRLTASLVVLVPALIFTGCQKETEPLHTRKTLLVDFGHDLVWRKTPAFLADLHPEDLPQEEALSTAEGETQKKSLTCFLPYSTRKPLSPSPPLYDSDRSLPSSLFYGGIRVEYQNAEEPVEPPRFELIANEPFQDSVALQASANGEQAGVRAYALFLWKKDHFLNAGNQHNVSTDRDSRMALYVGDHWVGWQEGRFLIGQEGRLYISRHTFSGASILHTLYPESIQWAEYNPRPPCEISFSPDQASFKFMKFTNITAVGFWLGKTDGTPPHCAASWQAFAFEANISMPWSPGDHIPMVKILSGDDPLAPGQDGLYISKHEVPYSLWHKVCHWAVRNQYSLKEGYCFHTDGDMGNMDELAGEHSIREPVTDITLPDALAWCNALSEYEGRIPAYYTDAQFQKVLRSTMDRLHGVDSAKTIRIFQHPLSNGYRIPTHKEWLLAATDKQKPSPATAWLRENSKGKTHPVASLKPGPNGLYDMIGNAWEMTTSINADHSIKPSRTVLLGGAYDTSPEFPSETLQTQYGSSPKAGFRLIRLEGQPLPLPEIKYQSPFVAYLVRGRFAAPLKPEPPGMVTIPAGTLSLSDERQLELPGFQISAKEIPFSEWRAVYQWATALGYEFNDDGDMGSMDAFTSPSQKHASTEPVTDISFHDALVWCNALSESQGLRPAYYTDSALTQLYRKTHPFRSRMVAGRKTPPELAEEGAILEQPVYVDWQSNGYRLPTSDEWEYAARAGSQETFYWGEDFDPDFCWAKPNSQGRTHPVGLRKKNAYGLFDTSGNVTEWCWPSASGQKPVETQSPIPVIRGGSFLTPAKGPLGALLKPGACDEVARGNLNPIANSQTGFRVVKRP